MPRHDRSPDRPSLGGISAAVGVFLLSMLLTAGFSLYSAQTTMERERIAFEALARRTQGAILQRMNAYVNLLYAGRAFLKGSTEVTRSDWRRFVSALEISSRFPGIQGIGYTVRLMPDEVAGHVARVRAGDMRDYRVWPPGERDEYTSIFYLEPMDARNRAAIGYDMFSEPTRRKAMARARDTGDPALTGKVSLVQEITADKQAGFLIYLPVYRNGVPSETVAQRREALIGYVYAPFRADDLFTGLFGHEPHPEIDFELYEGEPSRQTLLHDHNPAISSQAVSAGTIQLRMPTPVAGQTWTIVFTSTPAFGQQNEQRLPLLVFLGGTMISLLLGGITWTLASSRSRALAMATEMTAELRQADQAKDEFLSVISHELRTPLNFIMGFGSILQDEVAGPLEPKQHEYLEKMLNGADRMLILVNDLLDLAKIQAGKLDLLPQKADFVPVAEEAYTNLKPLSDQKGLELSTELPEKLELIMDGPRILQVLMNLLGNAIKFTPAGGKILLRGRFEDDALLVEIVDTGIGIAAEDLPKLFTRFRQLDMSSTRQAGGTGLGLSISKAIVESHGGQIGVRSAKGKGSTFWFRLPRQGPA